MYAWLLITIHSLGVFSTSSRQWPNVPNNFNENLDSASLLKTKKSKFYWLFYAKLKCIWFIKQVCFFSEKIITLEITDICNSLLHNQSSMTPSDRHMLSYEIIVWQLTSHQLCTGKCFCNFLIQKEKFNSILMHF